MKSMSETPTAKLVARAQRPVENVRTSFLHRLGEAMQRHCSVIAGVQWSIIGIYVALLVVPPFLDLPSASARMMEHYALLAQFVFWGVWWPFVILSVMFLGRVWCGVLCPEGALSEMASRHGLGRPIATWLQWPGWPLLTFVITTVYGQLVSVYDYPKPALLILGGSTVAAVAVGLVYGRGKRVWCLYLCPVSGVFGLLSRLAPLHFAVDDAAWRRSVGQRHAPVDCAPLVDMRRMTRATDCHLCGRCAGHRQAMALTVRPLGEGVYAAGPRERAPVDAMLIGFGLLGVAVGAFQWSASPWFIVAKQQLATWLLERDAAWMLNAPRQWWLLTYYPSINDVLTWLDGVLIVLYIGTTALVLGTLTLGGASLAGWFLNGKDRQFSMMLVRCAIPIAGISTFLGLSMYTVNALRAEGIALPWIDGARVAFLTIGVVWSSLLLIRTLATQGPSSRIRRLLAGIAASIGPLAAVASWTMHFFVW